MNRPVLICGCPGAGTSLVTKMLRHAGMFAGADAGPLDARKFHESKCFRDYNKQFLVKTIEFPHAPKGVRQFERHIASAQDQLESLVQLVDKLELLQTFCGEQQAVDIWGWKDPRNSATALIWREIFPDMRVLVIKRDWNPQMRSQSSGSPAGDWFRRESSEKLRKMYMQPPGIAGLDSHSVDFDNLLTDPAELESLLQWAELSLEPSQKFKTFQQQVGVEPF